jgi:hypothetical protein
MVSLEHPFPISTQESFFRLRRTVHVTGEFWLQVSSPGFQTVLSPLNELTGRSVVDTSSPTGAPTAALPTVEVRLETAVPD